MPIRKPTREEFLREMAAERIESYETVRSYAPEPRVDIPAVRERSTS